MSQSDLQSRLPPARQISTACVQWLSFDRRVLLLTIVLCAGCLIGMLMSSRLWVSARYYPLSPVTDKLPVVSPPFDYILFSSLLALLVFIAIVARPFKYLVGFLLVAVFMSLLDQSRWQPWFYQYSFMLAAICVYSWNSSNEEKKQELLNTCRLIIAAIYFWSGVQKLNPGFVDGVFPSLVNPYLNFIFGVVDLFPRWLIISVPLLEILIGIGLLTRRFRNVSVWLAGLLHVCILLLLIPVRRNSVVWPWNIAMASFAVILFWRAGDFSIRDVLLPRKLGFQIVVLILFGIMPVFSFVNGWDSYLSSTLYSGNTATAVIEIDESTKIRLPSKIQDYVRPGRPGGRFQIDLGRWSNTELNVPTYPEKRIFINITKQICAYAESTNQVSVTIYEKPNWLKSYRDVFTCNCSGACVDATGSNDSAGRVALTN